MYFEDLPHETQERFLQTLGETPINGHWSASHIEPMYIQRFVHRWIEPQTDGAKAVERQEIAYRICRTGDVLGWTNNPIQAIDLAFEEKDNSPVVYNVTHAKHDAEIAAWHANIERNEALRLQREAEWRSQNPG